ncbi:MAG: stage V sporulation protein AD [Ruminococcus sp.]|jgi:stage V sporulation protein AD|nr:stage V sporulation protein AD [Ruminococcus sp.]
MAKKIGRSVIKLENNVGIISYSAIAGKKESEGPVGTCFDEVCEGGYLDTDSFEKAEAELQKRAVNLALKKVNLTAETIDCIFSGDLLQGEIASHFGLRDFGIPLVGIYGACSTMAEGLILGSTFVDSGMSEHTVAVASSHFSSAERQFRFPLGYGSQRTPTAQWTATASGACLLAKSDEPPYVRSVCIGKIVDYGIKDAANMGAAMAPAAADTIKIFLETTGKNPSDYDVILTGDLGIIGSELVIELLQKDGIDISGVHKDCGAMLFDADKQDTHAGGSGCGCSASVLCGYFLDKIKSGNIKNMLFVATGALMSPLSSQQGESVPGIAHLVEITD